MNDLEPNASLLKVRISYDFGLTKVTTYIVANLHGLAVIVT